LKHFVMAITGASGAVYARRLAQEIIKADAHLHLIVSPAGRQLLLNELELRELNLPALVGHATDNATLHNYRDIGAKIASGSFITNGMVICPCSSNRLGSVASGMGGNLIDRAAAVTLKEDRRLVLVHREMPVSQIDITNMLRLSQAGAILCPASPGFYLAPQTVDDLVDFVVGRVLDVLGIVHDLRIRWDPPASDASE